jgi:hypothetical protein
MLFLRKHTYFFLVIVNYFSFLPDLAKYEISSSNRRSYEDLGNRVKLPCFEVSRQDTETLPQMYLKYPSPVYKNGYVNK